MLEVFASAGSVVSTSLAPLLTIIALIGSLLCSLFVVIGGYHYMTSSGNPERLIRAKAIIRNALIGLVIMLAAALLSNFLKSAYGPVAATHSSSVVPSLSSIKPSSSSDGLITVIIKAITGVLGSIIETVAVPFLDALKYFTSGTPLVAANHSVFDLWVSSIGIADALIVLFIMLIGLQVMGFISLGLESINIRQVLPQIGLVFVLINSSVFIIDAVINLSNILIRAISKTNAAQSVWQVLSEVVKQPSGYGLAALIIMTIFLVFSVILLVYYVGRIVTIYLGAVLAPLVILCWLLPSLRDMAVSATKRYFSAIFVLFIHVVILQLAASLLADIVSSQGSKPDPLMAMVIGLATLVALLKTQGVMSQLSYATIGPRMTRKIAERLILNASYISDKASSSISSYITGRDSVAISDYKNYANKRYAQHNSFFDTNPNKPDPSKQLNQKADKK
ncbi:MAG: hypothetical protein ACYCPS_04735 [Candidatus Saccharimonadales bacterium]